VVSRPVGEDEETLYVQHEPATAGRVTSEPMPRSTPNWPLAGSARHGKSSRVTILLPSPPSSPTFFRRGRPEKRARE